jgi:hypothetical protein
MLYREEDMSMRPLTDPQHGVQHVDVSVRGLDAGMAVMPMESTPRNMAMSGRHGCRMSTGRRTEVAGWRCGVDLCPWGAVDLAKWVIKTKLQKQHDEKQYC